MQSFVKLVRRTQNSIVTVTTDPQSSNILTYPSFNYIKSYPSTYGIRRVRVTELLAATTKLNIIP
jgi:hypothetical protein